MGSIMLQLRFAGVCSIMRSRISFLRYAATTKLRIMRLDASLQEITVIIRSNGYFLHGVARFRHFALA